MDSDHQIPGCRARLREHLSDTRWTLIRWVIAIPLILTFSIQQALGVESRGALGLGITLMIVGVVLLVPGLMLLLARLFGGILWDEKPGRKTPMYGIPESRLKVEKFDEAAEVYEKIIREFPDEEKPHVDLIRMALLRLRDERRAREYYDRAMSRLKSRDAQQRVTTAYEQLLSAFRTPKPEPGTVPYRRADGPPHK